MNRTLASLAIGTASLVLSLGAFAGGGARVNGQATQAPALHQQDSVRIQPSTTRMAPIASAKTQSSNSTTSSAAPTAHHATGQPGAECGSASAPNTPGRAASAPGSAFNPEGRAGQVHAGEQPQNSRNPVSVSQYDTACLHQP